MRQTKWHGSLRRLRHQQKALVGTRQIAAAEVREHHLELIRTGERMSPAPFNTLPLDWFRSFCPSQREGSRKPFERVVLNNILLKNTTVDALHCLERGVLHNVTSPLVSNGAFETQCNEHQTHNDAYVLRRVCSNELFCHNKSFCHN